MSEEETREHIEELINKEEPVKDEEIIEEEEAKPKAKPKAKSRAKPTIEITKEPVEPIVEEEPTVEEEPAPVKVDKLKQTGKCLDCNMDLTVHTLKYTHKRRGFCKAVKSEPEKTPEPVPEQPKPKITEEIVNDYVKQNPEIVSTYLRNERSMKAQKNQMHVRTL